jgi:hypothetical protein
MKKTCLINTKKDEKGIAGQARNDRYLHMKNSFLILILGILSVFPLASQNSSSDSMLDSYRYKVETFGSIAYQSTTPFWIHNGSYGIVPLESDNAYLRAGVAGEHHFNRSLRVEAGIDLLAKTWEENSHPVRFQQLYATVVYRILNFNIGSKENYHSILDKDLSSGDFSFSTNARPIPELNLNISDFVIVPYTKNFLSVKGDFAVGKFMDNNYILDVKTEKANYAQGRLLHHKSGYALLREPSGKIPLYLILGFDDCAQWGGWESKNGDLPQSFKDFFRVVTGASGGTDAPEGEQINRLGDHLGTYSFKLGSQFPVLDFAVYKQHFFTDNSGMEYANWRDGIWGIECSLPTFKLVKKVVFEYIQTTNQSGPFHFPMNATRPPFKVRIGGADSYYNHGIYTSGWSYFGKAIGNPLITSPEYNTDHNLEFLDNRIKAFHVGIKGDLSSAFSYRILGTGRYGYGTQRSPFLQRKHNFSGLLECTYVYPKWNNWAFALQVAGDKGTTFGNNLGCSFKITKFGNNFLQ